MPGYRRPCMSPSLLPGIMAHGQKEKRKRQSGSTVGIRDDQLFMRSKRPRGSQSNSIGKQKPSSKFCFQWQIRHKHDQDHLPHIDTNVTIFPKIVKQIKLVSGSMMVSKCVNKFSSSPFCQDFFRTKALRNKIMTVNHMFLTHVEVKDLKTAAQRMKQEINMHCSKALVSHTIWCNI